MIHTNGVKTFCGDYIEVMAEIPENSVDMVLCDLPYRMERQR